MADEMTKGEREDLQRLIRQREKALKGAARQRSAELLADFENQIGQEYRFDDDAVWEQAAEFAKEAVQQAQEAVAKRCTELGIPREFAPSLNLVWCHRGYGNSIEQRKAELRRMAKKRIDAIEAAAITKIEMHSVDMQTKIAMHGLTSDSAKEFMEKMPSVAALMPTLALDELTGKERPPIASQLVQSRAIASMHEQEAETEQPDVKKLN